MRTVIIRGIVSAAILAVASTAAAQTAGLLNTLELQRLVQRDEPEDHLRLAGHFVALAAIYRDAANRNEAFASTDFRNTNRPFQTPPAKWARLAALNREWADTATALANFHARAVFGLDAALPPGAGRFHGGQGAREPTPLELRALASAARTPSDHVVLEEYYRLVASREEETIRKHTAMALGIRGTPRHTGTGVAGVHCDRVIKEARNAAERALVNAMIHRQLAYIGN